MSLRRIAVLVLALAAACAKDVKPEASPAFIDYSVFDPSASAIPLPNDLALFSASSLPAGAQKDLLLAFAAQGGFPNDIEVPITIDFTRAPVGPGEKSAPTLDLTAESIRAPGTTDTRGPTLALFRVDVFPPAPAAFDTTAGAITQTQSGTKTTLRLRAPRASDGSRNWVAGAHYAVALRGGPNGVKTSDGYAIHPMPAMYLLLQGRNLADPANQSLLPDPSLGAQLEQIRQNYVGVFSTVDAVFPSREIANVATFQIAPSGGTIVRVDQTAGVVPLPFDLLRTDADGTIIYNTGFGPAAVGIDTLDGFSTTAMMLAQTSGPIDAATVAASNVFLFKLPASGSPSLVKDVAGALADLAPGEAAYLTQPPNINQACGAASPSGFCTTVIGLQPAVPVPTGTAAGTLYLPPLEEDTEYAIVVTRGVKDLTGAGLTRSTLAKIILAVAHPVSVGGVSQLAGIDDATAAMLEHMRTRLASVYTLLPGGKTQADVAMAYTFKTQSVTGTSLELSALPYAVEQGAGAAVFTPVASTIAAVDVTAAPYSIPASSIANVGAFYTMLTPTVDAIDPTTGALRANLATLTAAQMAALVKLLPALVALPLAANVPNCPAPVANLHCTKVVVFEHGLGGGHLQMIKFADALAARGFIVAAVDFPLDGDRAYCSTAADCNTGSTCDLIPGGAGQGDAQPPGICSNGNKLDPGGSLTSVASGRYFLTPNFFRMRDAFRQNLIDQSALALALARPPVPYAYPAPANAITTALAANSIVIDPTDVYLEGLSFGAIAGTDVLATNPRFSRGVLSVGGATMTDAFTNAPYYAAQVDALFLSLGIDRSQIPTDPAVAAKYLQTINVAKWILDPADPLNYARHVRTAPLPNLLSVTPALQSPKDVWGQMAQGDDHVPNPYNLLLYTNAAIPWTNYTKAGGNAPHAMLETEPTVQAHAASWLFDRTTPTATGGTFNLP